MNANFKLAKLLSVGDEIRNRRPSRDELVFNHSLLCTAGLPRKQTSEREFYRKCNEGWLYVQAGVLNLNNTPVVQPMPYGPLPRLALIAISTMAKRMENREVDFFRSASEFLKSIGLDTQGARYEKLWQQMNALVACRLICGLDEITKFEQPVKEFKAWIPHLSKNEWPGRITLTEDFFNALLGHAVPLDARAIIALRGSALALDIYTWLAVRLRKLKSNPLCLSWKALKVQFGQEYQGAHALGSFRKSFSAALKHVLIVYPQARVSIMTDGIEMRHSPPPVDPRQ